MAPKVASQFLLFKMNSFVAKAVIRMAMKIPGNGVHFLKPKVNTICHTLSSVAGQKKTILSVVA
jgi:hypothetical protein